MADDEQISEPESPAAEDVKSETNKTAEKAVEAHDSCETKKQPGASAENVTYDDNGDAIFSDPDTKTKYKWCKVTSQWKPLENEHYRWCNDTEKWIPKATENEFYLWCETTNRWVPKATQEAGKEDVVYGYDEKDACHTYTDKDGAVFFFDNEKKAWFPKVDDDFLAVYQLNYGFIDNVTKTEPSEVQKPPEPTSSIPDKAPADIDSNQPESSTAKKRKAPAEPPKWFEVDPELNTKVYVSNLPLDITEEEFAEIMGKCGMVMKDLKTSKMKLKLYRDASGELKGDGLCHYIKVCQFALKHRLGNGEITRAIDTMKSICLIFPSLFSLTSSSCAQKARTVFCYVT